MPSPDPASAQAAERSGMTLPASSSPARGPLHLLLLEDSVRDAELEVAQLENAGYSCEWERVQTLEDFLACLDAESYDCILSDYRLPDYNGLAALRLVRDKGLVVPFILVSGTLGEDEAIDSLRAGATDYVLKTRLKRLVPAVRRALAEYADAQRHRETEAARVEEAEVSGALGRVAHEMIASLDTPVLLRKLCQLTTELLQSDCSHTFLLQPDGTYVVMAGHCEGADDGDARRVERSAAGALAQLLGRLESDSVVELPADASPPGLLLPQVECTISGVSLYVALRRAAGIVGVLAANRRRAAPFTRTHRRMALGIAQLASLALANAHVVQELDEVSRLKSDFVAVMSHELRTPLHIIMGYGEMLANGSLGPLNANQREALQHSGRATRELLDLVNTTLDVGLLDAGASSLDIGTLDLLDLFAQIDTETEAARGDKPDLRMQLEVAPAARRLRIDRAKFKVIIKKVIDNAIKFTDTGTVMVDAHPHDGGIEITVTDTGTGITPEVLPVIFQSFRQGERALTRRHGGVGLGLHVARRLLDVLGGRITVASTPGQGSTFRIWVPSSGVVPAQRVQGGAA
ncbi:MAG: response regulator [Deltaproteobacteria bacterium]|nr:response regulator [Deltaproteobacteria bacterium]MBI3387906.1 response regulator [Deltaproteobacteria bacterium]